MRQRLLLKLTDQLGFPQSHIAVELSIKQMPHLEAKSLARVPQRRADILCYGRSEAGEGLCALLLIECKAVALNARVVRQTLGYNRYVQARYIALANQEREQTGWFDADACEYRFVEGLPHYSELSNKKI